MTTAIYAGSFDPFHIGHYDLLKRMVYHFENIFILQATNPDKKYMFSIEQRSKMINEVVKQFPNVLYDCWNGLLMDYAIQLNTVCVSIRGIRNSTDFEYEYTMSNINTKLGLETLFYPASPEVIYISSSAIKQLIKIKAPDHLILSMIPPCNQDLIREMIHAH